MSSRFHRRSLKSFERTAWKAERFLGPLAVSQPSRVITVPVRLPRPLALSARREIYSYPGIDQRRLQRRHIRLALLPLGSRRDERTPWQRVNVRIRLPHVLPLARGSKVSLSRRGMVIASAASLRRSMERLELNRRRYVEHKTNRRKARHGQLDSPGALGFGLVHHAFSRGLSVGRIADAALVARAILKGR